MKTYNNDANGFIDFAMYKMAREHDEAEAKKSDEATAARQASGMKDAEIRTVFGASSQPLLANRLALSNLTLYGAIKSEAFKRNIL